MTKGKTVLPLVFKAVGMAMGIATIVLSLLKAAETGTYLGLLGVGLFALGLASIIEHKTD